MDRTTPSLWTTIERATKARRGWVALAGIVLLSFAFRLHVARECSLWLDEVLTQIGALKPWPKVLGGPSKDHPPLMYLLVRVATDLVGSSETGLRSVSLLFGCVVLVALYELCLELGLTIWRALIVVSTLALSPFFIRHATEARHYAILAAFSTLATTRALRLLRGPQRARDLIGFAVSAVAAAATHYFGLAYALALLGLVSLGVAQRWSETPTSRRRAAPAALLVTLAPLGYLALRAAAVGRGYAVSEAGETASPEFNLQLPGEIAREFSFLANNVWWLELEAGLALVGLALFSRQLRGVARALPLGLGLAPCIAALFLSGQHSVAPRYLAPSLVLYHLGACNALFAAFDRLRLVLTPGGRLAWLAPSAGGLVLAGLLVARLREYPNGFGAGVDDYRGFQRYFSDKLARDTVLVAYPGPFGRLLLGSNSQGAARAVGLERLRPVRGVKRYLIVEIHSDTPARQAEIESLVDRAFGLPAQAWRSLPRVPVPHSTYQAAVTARLLQLPSDWVLPRRRGRPRRKQVGHD